MDETEGCSGLENKNNLLAVEIAVPVVVGVVALGAIAYFVVYPRLKLRRQVNKQRLTSEMDDLDGHFKSISKRSLQSSSEVI